MKSTINRWGAKIRVGQDVEAHHPRGGVITGTIVKIAREASYGVRITLHNGHTASVDDIKATARNNKILWEK